MKLSKHAVVFGTLALAVASAASIYRVNLTQSAMVGSTELKAGDYKIEVDGDKARIKVGKSVVEAPVKVETSNEKFDGTTVRYSNADGKAHVHEIRVGGTSTKLLFE